MLFTVTLRRLRFSGEAAGTQGDEVRAGEQVWLDRTRPAILHPGHVLCFQTARGGRGGSVGSVAAAGSRAEGANRVSGQVKPGRSSEKSHGVSRTPARGAESVSTKVCEHIQFILGSKAIFTSCLLVTKSACGAAGLF